MLHLLLIYIYEVIHDICLVVYDYVKSRIYFVLLVFSTHAFMCLLSVTRTYKLIQSCCCLYLQLIKIDSCKVEFVFVGQCYCNGLFL